MREKGYAAWIIPSSDPHQSEYVSPHFSSREYASGFSGSAGTLVLTQNAACLWTDSRYTLQAQDELKGSSISIMIPSVSPDFLSIPQWLRGQLEPGSQISFDGACLSYKTFKDLDQELALYELKLLPGPDLMKDIWPNRPNLEHRPLEFWPGTSAGIGDFQNFDKLLRYLAEIKQDWILLSALDQIAWILGLRGSDIPYNPLFYAYFLIGSKGSVLFIDQKALNQEIHAALLEKEIRLADYEALGAWLQTLAPGDKILLSPSSTSLYSVQNTQHMNQSFLDSPLDEWKACMSPEQILLLEEVCVRDGSALVQAFCTLENNLPKGNLDENAVADLLISQRSRQDSYKGESFPAIVGSGVHGAIVHYHAPEKNSAKLSASDMLLIDTGAHYSSGTTDVTRVFRFDQKPSVDERKFYTLVLKGHIALAQAVFPQGTRGHQLDILARQFLWDAGANYGHGTGHGIGFSLCVHQGPQRIAPLGGDQALIPGMLLSNEPGYYREGAFGIRLENMMYVQEHPSRKGFLCFKTCSLLPFEPYLIDLKLLTASEIQWLDQYHELVLQSLSKTLSREALRWLKDRCQALPQA